MIIRTTLEDLCARLDGVEHIPADPLQMINAISELNRRFQAPLEQEGKGEEPGTYLVLKLPAQPQIPKNRRR